MRPRIIRNKDIPADFMAISSKFSPRLPKFMSAAKSMANGNAMGTVCSVVYQKNSASTFHSTPFPISSARCFQVNCIMRIRIQMKKVMKK